MDGHSASSATPIFAVRFCALDVFAFYLIAVAGPPLFVLAVDAVREQHLHVDEKDRALALLAAVGRHQSVGDLAGDAKELS